MATIVAHGCDIFGYPRLIRLGRVLAVTAAAALGVRLVQARKTRFLHPDGRSFAGELTVWGTGEPTGAALIDRPGRHPATVRISKGAGTKPGRHDVLGFSLRITNMRCDLLFSTAGRGRWLRHLPVLRGSFDTLYGTILPYRTGTGTKLYLTAEPDPRGLPLGNTLETVAQAAAVQGGELLLGAARGGAAAVPWGRVRFGDGLPALVDAELAFDPIRNAPPDLHPTGTIHGVRAAAYRLSQQWRGARPAGTNPAAVARTTSHR
jgi:hypothetical protein